MMAVFLETQGICEIYTYFLGVIIFFESSGDSKSVYSLQGFKYQLTSRANSKLLNITLYY